MKICMGFAVLALALGAGRSLQAQGAPDIVWRVPTPSGLANSVQAVAWSPTDDNIAVGSTDRWFRLREASTGALQYSVLEPINSSGVGHILYSNDGTLIGVRNQSSGLSFRVQRMTDGAFLGTVLATVGANSLVTFAPDATLLANTGGDGTISSWHFSDLTMFQVTGSGYQKVTTTFNFSPDGLLQSAAKKGVITIQRRTDGAVITRVRGGSVVTFSPDSSLLAAWSSTPTNAITIWRTSDWSVLHTLASSASNEGIGALRFSPDGQRLVSTGYLPFQVAGLWEQKGIIRFWDVVTGAAVVTYDQQTDLAVTSPVAWSPDGSQFGYGLYDGTVAVANTPN